MHEVRSYLDDKSPQRYETLVNQLLSGTDHATHLAAMFRSFLISESVDLTRFGGVEAFDEWLAGRFQSNDSYAEIVQSLLLAEGRLSRSGPLLFYSASKLDAEQLAARTARVFLGTRLECAQCHDHPFEPWTQEDFWGFAAFFARISRPRGTLENASAVLQVHDVEHGDVMMPETETVVAPKYLNASAPLTDEDPSARRRLLSEWMTGKENPYFARATANRVWAQMFGKGIVEPLDDFGVQHPARSAELLDLLSGHLINTDFNLRELFRAVVAVRGVSAFQWSGDGRRRASGMVRTDECEDAHGRTGLRLYYGRNADAAGVELRRIRPGRGSLWKFFTRSVSAGISNTGRATDRVSGRHSSGVDADERQSD